jgi:hypothetical protein
MNWVATLLSAFIACSLSAADTARISYIKSFPGSMPAWQGITVERNGAAEYKEAADDDRPLKFQLAQADVDEIFSLAEKLGYFRRPLEAPVKVAFMGMKTFRFENGTDKAEVKFNYSEDPAARTLADWFERISESEQHVINLERTVKYDKLGVLRAILLLEASMERKRLVALDQFLPLLDRVTKNESYMHAARVRAAAMAEFIRASSK